MFTVILGTQKESIHLSDFFETHPFPKEWNDAMPDFEEGYEQRFKKNLSCLTARIEKNDGKCNDQDFDVFYTTVSFITDSIDAMHAWKDKKKLDHIRSLEKWLSVFFSLWPKEFARLMWQHCLSNINQNDADIFDKQRKIYEVQSFLLKNNDLIDCLELDSIGHLASYIVKDAPYYKEESFRKLFLLSFVMSYARRSCPHENSRPLSDIMRESFTKETGLTSKAILDDFTLPVDHLFKMSIASHLLLDYILDTIQQTKYAYPYYCQLLKKWKEDRDFKKNHPLLRDMIVSRWKQNVHTFIRAGLADDSLEGEARRRLSLFDPEAAQAIAQADKRQETAAGWAEVSRDSSCCCKCAPGSCACLPKWTQKLFSCFLCCLPAHHITAHPPFGTTDDTAPYGQNEGDQDRQSMGSVLSSVEGSSPMIFSAPQSSGPHEETLSSQGAFNKADKVIPLVPALDFSRIGQKPQYSTMA